METQEPSTFEGSSKIAQQNTHADGARRVASGTPLVEFLSAPNRKKIPFYAVAAVVLLLGSVILGCLMFIEQQSKQQALLVASSQAPQQAQPGPPEETSAAPKPHNVPRLKAHAPWKIMASASGQPIPAELTINTQPQGARAEIDGRSSADWVTPYVAEQLAPGKHTVTLRKAGYRPESRNFELPEGKRLVVSIPLTELAALVDISSQPLNASVVIDGVETGRATPTQIAVSKGYHTVTVRKAGYFDATRKVDLGPGQDSHLVLAMEPIRGDVQVRPVKKLRKIYGKVPAGMGWVQIKTIPKGAQISVNRRLMDEPAPTEFLLEIGNYEVTLTLNGYKPVQKVIHIEDGSRIELSEVLEREY